MGYETLIRRAHVMTRMLGELLKYPQNELTPTNATH